MIAVPFIYGVYYYVLLVAHHVDWIERLIHIAHVSVINMAFCLYENVVMMETSQLLFGIKKHVMTPTISRTVDSIDVP